jgi:Na+/proline symporter
VTPLCGAGIALTAEYTAVGDLFEYTIGSKRWPIVVIIAAVATLYTAYGGLLISIITDQWQVGTPTRPPVGHLSSYY